MLYFPNITDKQMYKLCNGFTLEQIEGMYIDQNYSMELVSKCMAVPMPVLSRILQDTGLAEKKNAMMENRTYEKKALNQKKKLEVDAVDEGSVWSEL